MVVVKQMKDFYINILTVTFRFKGYVLVEIMYKQIFSCRDIDMVDRATRFAQVCVLTVVNTSCLQLLYAHMHCHYSATSSFLLVIFAT